MADAVSRSDLTTMADAVSRSDLSHHEPQAISRESFQSVAMLEFELDCLLEVLRRQAALEHAAVDEEGRRRGNAKHGAGGRIGLHFLNGLLVLRVEVRDFADTPGRVAHRGRTQR